LRRRAAGPLGVGSLTWLRAQLRAANYVGANERALLRRRIAEADRPDANKNGRHAFRRCVRQHVRQSRQTCRTERKADPAAFKAKYGNEKGHHAFRRCVRQHEADPVS
jgi:hypothetical protein